MAASVIHDGYYAGMHTGTVPAWQDGDRIDAGMELTMSHDIYAEGIRKCGTKGQQDTIKTAKVIKRTYMLLGVTDVVMPETLPPVEGEALTGLKTLGVLKLKPWVMEDGDSVNPEIPADEMGEFDLWLEKENLQYCFKGMKIEARVHRLDNGMRFIDSITVNPTSLSAPIYSMLMIHRASCAASTCFLTRRKMIRSSLDRKACGPGHTSGYTVFSRGPVGGDLCRKPPGNSVI